MSFSLTKPYPRLWSLDAGLVMVVTDLHGDWNAYQSYRNRFLDLQAEGKADCLIFTGDLIHQESSPAQDCSLEIVLDILKLQSSYGSTIIYLCGNHELPHIYSIGLGKGDVEYTPSFEAALSRSGHRSVIIDLLDALPFYVRTAAGVSITHAGAAAVAADRRSMSKLFSWSHKKQLADASILLEEKDTEKLRRGYAKLSQAESYEALARHYLAVTGPSDPRFDDLLRGAFATGGDYNLVHSALFTKCEQEYGVREYSRLLKAMLEQLSTNYIPQQILVAGHMKLSGGYEIVAERHLRLASAHHAVPPEAGLYLLFDAAKPIKTIEDLLAGLDSVY